MEKKENTSVIRRGVWYESESIHFELVFMYACAYLEFIHDTHTPSLSLSTFTGHARLTFLCDGLCRLYTGCACALLCVPGKSFLPGKPKELLFAIEKTGKKRPEEYRAIRVYK